MKILSLSFVLLSFCTLHAQPTENSAVESLAVQPDGKIVAGGTSSLGDIDRFAIARFLSDGTPDGQFGTKGKVTTVIGKGSKLFALKIQQDGKIVAAGYANTGKSHAVALARYNSDGKIDVSFGKGGFVTTESGSSYARAFELLIQPDGKLVAIGHSNTKPAGGFDFLAIRYGSDGSLDKSFGTGGIVHTRVGTQNNGGQTGALQPDGKILVAGHYAAGKVSKFAVARYMSNGTPDISFGTRGLMLLPIRGSASAITALADGGIMVAGDDGKLADEATGIVTRLGPDGKTDTTFGNKGTFLIGNGNPQTIRASPDGTFKVTGWYFSQSNSDPKDPEAPTTSTCDIIRGFDRKGALMTHYGRVSDDEFQCFANDISFQSDGKVLVGGGIGPLMEQTFVIFRFDRNGVIDTFFGGSGKVTASFAN